MSNFLAEDFEAIMRFMDTKNLGKIRIVETIAELTILIIVVAYGFFDFKIHNVIIKICTGDYFLTIELLVLK